MAFPVAQALGTQVNSSSTTGFSPALPAGIVSGDVLFGWCISKATGKVISVDAAWTMLHTINSGGASGALAWRLADGSTDAAPSFTWTGATAGCARTARYNGVSSPYIGSSTVSTGTGTVMTETGFTTASDYSKIVSVELLDNNVAPGTPPGYTGRGSVGNGNGFQGLFDGDAYKGGSTVPSAVSAHGSSVNWIGFLVELIGSGTASGEPAIRVTQVAKQVLTAQQSDNIRVTQVAMQVLRSEVNKPEAGGAALLVGL